VSQIPELLGDKQLQGGVNRMERMTLAQMREYRQKHGRKSNIVVFQPGFKDRVQIASEKADRVLAMLDPWRFK